MIDHPVFVPTTAGPVGGIVTVPSGPTRGAVVLLDGWSGTRAGPNAVWTRAARLLAADGLVVLRFDYPGVNNSDLARADEKSIETALREVVAWYLERCGLPEISIVGYCLGTRYAMQLATAVPEVARVALLLPPLPAPGETLPARTQGLHSLDLFVACTSRIPVWVLVGERDSMTPDLHVLREWLGDRGTFEFEVVPDMELHSFALPEIQQALLQGVVDWSARTWPRSDPMNTADRISAFLDSEILDRDPTAGGPVAVGDPLAEGRLDSLAMEQLICFVEEEFALSIDDEEFVAENFASIDVLARFVDAKRAVVSPS